jgi:hypothetical protein
MLNLLSVYQAGNKYADDTMFILNQPQPGRYGELDFILSKIGLDNGWVSKYNL